MWSDCVTVKVIVVVVVVVFLCVLEIQEFFAFVACSKLLLFRCKHTGFHSFNKDFSSYLSAFVAIIFCCNERKRKSWWLICLLIKFATHVSVCMARPANFFYGFEMTFSMFFPYFTWYLHNSLSLSLFLFDSKLVSRHVLIFKCG